MKVFILQLNQCVDGYAEDQSSIIIGVFSTLQKAKWEAQNFHNNSSYKPFKLIFNTDNTAVFKTVFDEHEYDIEECIIDHVPYHDYCKYSKIK